MKETTNFKEKCHVQVTFAFIKTLTFLGKIMFDHLKKRGIVPIVWVLNTPEEF